MKTPRTGVLTIGLVAALAALPVVAAQNNTIYNNPSSGTPPTVDVNVNNPAAPQQSTGFAGLSGTAIIVLVVLAVIVIALIVALASRDRYP